MAPDTTRTAECDYCGRPLTQHHDPTGCHPSDDGRITSLQRELAEARAAIEAERRISDGQVQNFQRIWAALGLTINASMDEALLAIRVGRESAETVQVIDQLRDPEGASVTILCPNSDFNGLPDQAIEVSAEWTGWQPKRYSGDTIIACLMLADADRQPAPGPSDAKGENQFLTALQNVAKNLCQRAATIYLDTNPCACIYEAFAKVESRPSLTPLTDESVRGVLVDDGEPTHIIEEGNIYWHNGVYTPDVTRDSNLFWQPLKLVPASEFCIESSTPAEPAQKLVPIEPVWKVIRIATDYDGSKPTFIDTAPCSSSGKYWVEVDKCSLYGVDAERVRELEAEVENLKALRQDDLTDYESLLQEAGRLRKAIEEIDAPPEPTK